MNDSLLSAVLIAVGVLVAIGLICALILVIAAKFWCKTADYWTVYFNVLEAVKKAFDANGIEIPFNQLDVHVKNS